MLQKGQSRHIRQLPRWAECEKALIRSLGLIRNPPRIGGQGAIRLARAYPKREKGGNAMTTEELHERLLGIQGRWDQALAGLEEVSGGLEAIIKTPGENDLVAIAKHYGDRVRALRSARPLQHRPPHGKVRRHEIAGAEARARRLPKAKSFSIRDQCKVRYGKNSRF